MSSFVKFAESFSVNKFFSRRLGLKPSMVGR